MTVIKQEMLSKKITKSDILPLSFINLSPYTGSKGNMRYRIEKCPKENEESEDKLQVTVWYGPLAFECTDEALKITELFEFSEYGLNKVIDYLENKRLQNY